MTGIAAPQLFNAKKIAGCGAIAGTRNGTAATREQWHHRSSSNVGVEQGVTVGWRWLGHGVIEEAVAIVVGWLSSCRDSSVLGGSWVG